MVLLVLLLWCCSCYSYCYGCYGAGADTQVLLLLVLLLVLVLVLLRVLLLWCCRLLLVLVMQPRLRKAFLRVEHRKCTQLQLQQPTRVPATALTCRQLVQTVGSDSWFRQLVQTVGADSWCRQLVACIRRIPSACRQEKHGSNIKLLQMTEARCTKGPSLPVAALSPLCWHLRLELHWW